MTSDILLMFTLGFIGLFVICLVICMYLISIYYDVKELQESLATLRRIFKDEPDCRNHIANNDSPVRNSFKVFGDGTILENQGNHQSDKVED